MKHSILMVDDNPTNLKLGASVLSPYYKLSITDNGVVAIKIAELQMPDLILLDVMMPGMSGFDVCKYLKQNEKTRKIPIIFLTAKNEEGDIVMGFEIGGADYILKPFKTREMLSRIKIQVDLKEAQDKLKQQNEELSNAQDRLKRQNEELKGLILNRDKLFSIIANDLRSPFAGILGITGLMSEGFDELSKKELTQIGRAMYETSLNVYKLIENLLDWSRIQKGQIDYNPVEVNIYKIIEQSIHVIHQRAAQKGIVIFNEVSENIRINADELMLLIILKNLISNAVKFTTRGGTITITSDKSTSKEIIISIHDTGIGISADNVNRLFKIGENVKSNGTDGEPSAGLGLLLCKEFVEQHNGRIWLESEEKKGSTFYVALPNVG
ncbi:MAG: hybrid sensor histidine kinase/response regulator [Ignavibacteria bacterium]